MADIATTAGTTGPGSTLSVTTALRLAWVVWSALLIAPFLMFLCVVWTLMQTHIENGAGVSTDKQTWFLAAAGYLLVAVPASFFWRGHVFKAYWSGKTIPPGKYLFGMISVWMALVIGGIFSLVGCFVDHSLLPNLLPALLAFMFYVTLWPSGRAMVRTVGNSEDAAVYEPPR